MFATSKTYAMHVSLIFIKIISPIFVSVMHLLLLPQHMFSNMFAASKDYVTCLPLIFKKVIYLIFCFCNTFTAFPPTDVLATCLPLQKIMRHVCHSS